MIDVELQQALAQALAAAQQAEALPIFDLPDDIPVERPNEKERGDFATPVCLQLARQAHMAPLKIAEIVADRLPEVDFVEDVQVAAPGFINFLLSEAWLADQVEAILAQGEGYGRSNVGEGISVQVEHGSANPTGPLHMGFARNVVLGDALASLLDAAGHDVQREYYVNNAGSRMEVFYESMYARYAQALGRDESVPEDGYHGAYMIELGERAVQEYGETFLEMPRPAGVASVGELGLEWVVEQARADLALMGIHYDRWFPEQSLYENGEYEIVMEILDDGGYLYEAEGAVWFKATALGGDKDEVVVRSDGTPGYFASDIAYHYNKFVERGFDRVIDVWGADHQGHVPRMKSMMEALGLDSERLTLILYQLVTLKRGEEIVRLSKRSGDIVTLREVLEEVGSDAMRFFLVSRSADSQMEFDLDLAKRQSDENPVYYIQYAHARISSILRRAEGFDADEGDVRLLTSEAELALIREMVRLPEVVVLAAEQLAPHHLAYYAHELASAFHAFYRDCRVISSAPDDRAISQARLKLVTACRQVLANVLHLMGMTAPKVM